MRSRWSPRGTDGEPLGYAFVQIRARATTTPGRCGRHLAELVSLAVAPERARSAAWATALLDAVDAELERRGVHDLEVAVDGRERARPPLLRAPRAARRRALLFRFGGAGAESA